LGGRATLAERGGAVGPGLSQYRVPAASGAVHAAWRALAACLVPFPQRGSLNLAESTRLDRGAIIGSEKWASPVVEIP
jgi:hypothetical protein